MTEQQIQIDWAALLKSAGPYPLNAFHFVREGLGYTVQRIHEDLASRPEGERHVSGQQLCLGLRDFAIQQYGMLAPTVLAHWKITRTDDFGRIVFAMIEAGLMSKTDQDSLEDFRAVFDFHEAFGRPELETHIGRSD